MEANKKVKSRLSYDYPLNHLPVATTSMTIWKRSALAGPCVKECVFIAFLIIYKEVQYKANSKVMQSYNKNSNLAGAMASSTTEITKEGDGIRVNTQSTVKSSNFVFPDGKATEYTTMDGRKTMVRMSRLN